MLFNCSVRGTLLQEPCQTRQKQAPGMIWCVAPYAPRFVLSGAEGLFTAGALSGHVAGDTTVCPFCCEWACALAPDFGCEEKCFQELWSMCTHVPWSDLEGP